MKKMILQLLGVGIVVFLAFPVLAKQQYISSSDDKYRYYGWQLCGYPQFNCIQVSGGVTWKTLWPDAWQREMIQRLNRTNVAINSRPWLVVPKQVASLSYKQLSPFPAERNTQGKRLVVVNLTLQAFAAYDEQGSLIHWGPASGGRDFCPDVNRKCNTPTGYFKIESKQGPDCISTKYPIEKGGGAKMPYCMFFYRGFGLHGSTELPGYNASHGCVRLYVDDARWLNLYFARIGTPVIVTK